MKKQQLSTLVHSSVRVIPQQLGQEQPQDANALHVLSLLKGRVGGKLLHRMHCALLGFNSAMQLEMADDMIDFYFGRVCHTTGISHVDRLLVELYCDMLNEMRKDNDTERQDSDLQP